ncbi:hypothetical protein [Variovorax sp. tm]|uniref:hypothetical protein n=1 Tax=Variovorax atrisoli TaxID=3394203 RepID=UPI003A7FEC56
MEAESLAAFARKNGLSLKVDIEPQRDQVIVVRDAATPAPTMVDSEYPPLPESTDELAMDDGFNVIGAQAVYTADQMRAYVDADRATRPTLQSLGGDAGVGTALQELVALNDLKRNIEAAHQQPGVIPDFAALDKAAADYWARIGKAWKAARAALSLSLTSTEKSDGTVPEGWQLVPIDPTDAMIRAGYDAENNDGKTYLRPAWRYMLAAAPKAAEKSGRSECAR